MFINFIVNFIVIRLMSRFSKFWNKPLVDKWMNEWIFLLWSTIFKIRNLRLWLHFDCCKDVLYFNRPLACDVTAQKNTHTGVKKYPLGSKSTLTGVKKHPHWGQKAPTLGSKEANDWMIAVLCAWKRARQCFTLCKGSTHDGAGIQL